MVIGVKSHQPRNMLPGNFGNHVCPFIAWWAESSRCSSHHSRRAGTLLSFLALWLVRKLSVCLVARLELRKIVSERHPGT
eukprot:1371000-Amphidinium_carterae.1